MERYLLTLRAAKAALVAYAHAPSDQTFVLACEAVNDHQKARRAFLKDMTPQHPPGGSTD